MRKEITKKQFDSMSKKIKKIDRMVNGDCEDNTSEIALVVRKQLQEVFNTEKITNSLNNLKTISIVIIILLIFIIVLMFIFQSQFIYVDELPTI